LIDELDNISSRIHNKMKAIILYPPLIMDFLCCRISHINNLLSIYSTLDEDFLKWFVAPPYLEADLLIPAS